MVTKKLSSFIGIFVFIFLLCGISLLMFNQQELEKEKNQEMKLDGVNVYLEDNEISALVVSGDKAYVGGRDGVFVINIESGEIVEKLSEDLSLIYTASMIISSDNKLWVGHDSGLSVMYDEKWIHYQSPDIPKGRCNKILEVDQIIYAGFQEGLVIFEKKSSEEYEISKILTKEDGLAENNVNAIYSDQINQLWLGAYLSNQVGGISIIANDHISYFSTDQGLTHKYVTDIKGFFYNGSNYTLVGCGHLTSGGLNLFEISSDKNTLVNTFSIDQGIPGEKIRSLYVSENEEIWITTESDGLLIISKNELFSENLQGIYLDKYSGLSDNEIKIVSENESFYILGGRFGITTIDKNVIENLMDN